MNAQEAEERDNAQLRKAHEALQYARGKENEARKALAYAVSTTATMKIRFEEAFAATEARAAARRRAGLIENNAE